MADDRDRDEKRTTIVTSDGDGRSSATIILFVALVAILLAVLFFGGVFDRDDESALNIEVNTPPDINMTVLQAQPLPPPVIITPDTHAPPPDVNINVTTPPPPEENVGDVDET